jgi:hypothetical protein
MELSELFIDKDGDLLYGEYAIDNEHLDINYYSYIVDGVYLLPFDFIVQDGGMSYKYYYNGTERLDFLTYDIKEL